MEGRCERHLFDRAVDLCGRCGGEFCPDCLVYSFGPKKPPFCLPCAVARGGVRSNAAARPALSRREQRQLRKQREVAARTGRPVFGADPGDDDDLGPEAARLVDTTTAASTETALGWGPRLEAAASQ